MKKGVAVHYVCFYNNLGVVTMGLNLVLNQIANQLFHIFNNIQLRSLKNS